MKKKILDNLKNNDNISKGVHSLDKLLKGKMKKDALEEMKQKNKLKDAFDHWKNKKKVRNILDK